MAAIGYSYQVLTWIRWESLISFAALRMTSGGGMIGIISVFFKDSLRLCENIFMYTELQVTSNFTFLRGASHPDELAQQAALLGYKHIAITDRNTFAGVVRAHVAAKRATQATSSSSRL